jgi:hypothetical protein
MRYVALIYGNENAEFTEEQGAAEMQAYIAFGDEGDKAGVIKGGDALQPTSTATTVTVRDGETLTTDGPFAETKEQLGGYYELHCDNLDQAIEWAAKIPGALHGRIEVRPIMEFDQA